MTDTPPPEWAMQKAIEALDEWRDYGSNSLRHIFACALVAERMAERERLQMLIEAKPEPVKADTIPDDLWLAVCEWLDCSPSEAKSLLASMKRAYVRIVPEVE